MKRIIEIIISGLLVLTINNAPALAGVRENLVKDSNVVSLYSIDDNYTMIAVRKSAMTEDGFTAVREFSNGPLSYRIIRHGAEEFLYKGTSVPPYSSVEMLPNGEFNFSAAGYTAIDLYEHMYAVCRKNNGRTSFVVPVKYGQFKRLTEVSPVDAFSYILSSADGNSSWFMACDGAKRFVVEKNYSFKGAVQTAAIRAGRNLEGVSYIKGDKEIATLLAYQAGAVSEKDEKTVLEESAEESAMLGMDFVKVHNGIRYVASYKRTTDGCGMVEVKKTGNTEGSKVAKVYDFKVCKDRISKLGEREVTPDSSGNIYASALIEPMK